MIKKIVINNIASYKSETVLETDKKVNLIYGINGAGKTILSNYLASLNEKKSNEETSEESNKFRDCKNEGFNKVTQKTLVYNQQYIDENFYQEEKQSGIFTLNKENKKALENIKEAEIKKQSLNNELEDEDNGLKKKLDEKNQDKSNLLNDTHKQTWKIKTTCTGGDRIFDDVKFLDKLKGNKVVLFDYLKDIPLPEKPQNTIENIKKVLQELFVDNANKRDTLPNIQNLDIISQIENNKIFSEVIVGNKDNPVADLIIKLENSDWVKQGFSFVDKLGEKETCPFCQKDTLNKDLITNIRSYFDETYDRKIRELKELELSYKDFSISEEDYQKDFLTEQEKEKITLLLSNLEKKRTANLNKIKDKIQNPSQKIELQSTAEEINKINQLIEEINKENVKFNQRIENKEQTKEKLKQEFWDIQRYEYNDVLTKYQKEDKKLNEKIKKLQDKANGIKKEIDKQTEIIQKNQKQTTNIDESIRVINKMLDYLGITDITIEKIDEDYYKIARGGDKEHIYKSLSEGEKTIITFLYFLEQCINKESKDDTKQKIIVIDDPISSLSHNYVFNVSRLIKDYFTNFDEKNKNRINDCLQCFILTHNLYFFYDLAHRDKIERKENQKLFRIFKNKEGSHIIKLKYNEIQNDYQAYWEIIKNYKKNNPRIIASAMRNVIEYFFGFMEKQESLNNIFQSKELNK